METGRSRDAGVIVFLFDGLSVAVVVSDVVDLEASITIVIFIAAFSLVAGTQITVIVVVVHTSVVKAETHDRF